MIEGPHARDQIVFSTFHSFLVKFQTNAAYISTSDACVLTTWRLGLRAPLLTRNNYHVNGY